MIGAISSRCCRIVCRDNRINTLPDLSSLVGLKVYTRPSIGVCVCVCADSPYSRLECNKNQLKVLPNLSGMPQLEM